MRVFVTTNTEAVTDIYKQAGIRTLSLIANAPNGALAYAMAYLASDCDVTVLNGHVSAGTTAAQHNSKSEASVAGVAGGIITFPLSVIARARGKYFRLCIDEDGANHVTDLGFGDAGLSVYVTGIEGVKPNGVAKATDQ